MRHSMRVLSAGGDTTLAEWDADTDTPTIDDIEQDFDHHLQRGYLDFDITRPGEGRQIQKFDRRIDILLAPKVSGGA